MSNSTDKKIETVDLKAAWLAAAPISTVTFEQQGSFEARLQFDAVHPDYGVRKTDHWREYIRQGGERTYDLKSDPHFKNLNGYLVKFGGDIKATNGVWMPRYAYKIDHDSGCRAHLEVTGDITSKKIVEKDYVC